MGRVAENLRALLLSLAVHALCLLLVAAGLWWTHKEATPSVAGSPVEAVLITAPPAASRPSRAPAPAPPAAPPPQPRPTPSPQRAEVPPQPRPQAPQPRPDTRDAEAAARLAQRQAEEKARREEQERRRQEQVLLEEKRRQEEAERRERLRKQQEEREKQLAEIRRQREAAERRRKLEAERLRQLEDARRQAAEAAEARRSPEPPADRLGNQGADESLLGRYQIAIQQAVQQNWLRPESARPGIRCTLHIVQIPGGEVIQAAVVSPCNADELTRRSIEAAVLKAQPLPYSGFESVFRREIRFTFRYDGD
ncbi:MAG: hypothetical protein KatS3mg126_1206 [Lysobacteraceae bacterium]|nr:MAG: hypothetical protein KatS3mg126_1206 [Xanthomonadaceae bacterium]